MASEKMIQALNEQVNAEFFSAYFYMSMATYFEDKDLPGFANWMEMQAQEELFHGKKIYDYIIRRGGRVILTDIKAAKSEWDSPVDVFEDVLAHEEHVSSLINNLVDIAIEEKDHATNQFLQWFVEEQVEEEESAGEALMKVKRAAGKEQMLYMIDNEFASRTFTPSEE